MSKKTFPSTQSCFLCNELEQTSSKQRWTLFLFSGYNWQAYIQVGHKEDMQLTDILPGMAASRESVCHGSGSISDPTAEREEFPGLGSIVKVPGQEQRPPNP